MLIIEQTNNQIRKFAKKDASEGWRRKEAINFDDRNMTTAQMIMSYEYDLEPEDLNNVYYIQLDESREWNAFTIESLTKEKELEYRYQILDCYLYDHYPDYYFGSDELDEELKGLITRHKEERNLTWDEVGFLFEAYQIDHEYFVDMEIDKQGEKTILYAAIYEEM